jgi:HUS1 checkpoint protein
MLQDTIFDPYNIQSAAASNAINLEVPLPPLLSALRSTSNATSASIRLTKRDGAPYLVITIATSVERWHGANNNPSTVGVSNTTAPPFRNQHRSDDLDDPSLDPYNPPANNTVQLITRGNSSETIITQDIPVRVLGAEAVAGLHEPRCREPDVHIVLPPLTQLKGISERFMKLAVATSSGSTSTVGGRAGDAATGSGSSKSPRLELSATMHGDLRLALRNDGLKIASTWTGLTNPELDPGAVEGGEEGVQRHPSTRMRGRMGRAADAQGEGAAAHEEDDEEDLLERGWARVRIDGRDWSRVLSVGRLGGRVIACEC